MFFLDWEESSTSNQNYRELETEEHLGSSKMTKLLSTKFPKGHSSPAALR